MKLRSVYQRYMLRPLIYLTAFRLMLAAIFLLILIRFVPNGPAPSLIAGFLTVLFALFAYLVYLRLDGLRIPRMKPIKRKRKSDPLRNFGAMADYADEEPQVTFEELEPEERDLCSLLANLICLVVYLVLSFIL